MNNWLVLDVNYLAHRARHTTGGLSHEGDATGVSYGLLRDILSLQKEFNTDRIAFCFDQGPLLREQVYPNYKVKRRKAKEEMDHEQRIEMQEFYQQVGQLQHEFLTAVGFMNVFFEEGYEADDVIASVVKHSGSDNDYIIVSADSDLYQLLDKNVCIYNPSSGKMRTVKTFKEEYGIRPHVWAKVKAMTGCDSDCIEGLKGIGPQTALKYILGVLKPESAAYQLIESKPNKIRKNLSLIKLPYEGCPKFELQDDVVTPKRWAKLLKRLGIKSLDVPGLEDLNPIGVRPRG